MPELSREEHETARLAALDLNEGRGQDAANVLRNEYMRLSSFQNADGRFDANDHFMRVVAETQRMENHAPGLPELTVTNAVDPRTGQMQVDQYGRPTTDVSVMSPGLDQYNRPVTYKDGIAMVPPPPVPVPVEAPPPVVYEQAPVVVAAPPPNPWSVSIGIVIGGAPHGFVERPHVVEEHRDHDHDDRYRRRDRDRR